jgi:YVTN family beta-propeller protein
VKRSLYSLVAVVALAAAGAGQAACNKPASDAERGPAPAAPPAPRPPAAPSPGVHLYVTDETGGNLVVVDPDGGQVIEHIAVGKRPRGLRLGRDGTQLFVALSGSPIGGPNVDESKLPPPDRAADGIGVVDLASRKVVRTLPSGQDPESFDMSSDGSQIYVSNEDSAEMSVVDLTSGSVKTRVKVGEEPEAVTLRPDGRIAYVGCEGENEVFAVDTATAKVVGRVKTGARPRGIAFTADSTTAFVANETDGTITVIDAQKHVATGTIKIPRTEGTPTPPRPMYTLVAPDGRNLFVSLGRARSVAVIDIATRQFVRSIEDVGTRPWGIALSADGKKLYTANGGSGDVSVVDVESGKVDRRITTGGSPWGVAVSRAQK